MLRIIFSILHLATALVLILVVLGQSGKHTGVGVVGGFSDTFLAKNKGKSTDAKLSRITKWCAILFFVLTLVLTLI